MRFLFSLFLISLIPQAFSQTQDCAVCVVALGLVQQLSSNYTSNPDSDCKALGFCTGACVFWNPWPSNAAPFPSDGGAVDSRRSLRELASEAQRASSFTREAALDFVRFASARLPPASTLQDALGLLWRYLAVGATSGASPCSDGLDIVCDFERPFQYHLPMIDHDGDNFAGDPLAGDFLNQHFRGRSWRGKDCNDSSAEQYPGRLDAGGRVDSNCNGISGTDPASGKAYEELFCSGDNAPMGVAIVGDSAAAHFHIPPQFLNAPTFNASGILEMASNEADWPQCSWATGYRNESAACPKMGRLDAPPASFYQRWLELNLCAHGDVQNIGVNGARTGSMAPPGVINALARNKSTDAPLLVIYALIGNDVCNGHPGSADWTTVSEFQSNVLASLDYLDRILPQGSHVAFLGLADGRVLYDTTHTRTHPIGQSYPSVYEFLSCNNCNPCWGWLNTNETWRNATSERAFELTAVYDSIIAANSTRYNSFDVSAGAAGLRALNSPPPAHTLSLLPLTLLLPPPPPTTIQKIIK